jgi:Fic family protein
MILNHRDAIRYLLDNIKDVEIDWTTLRDLHAMLSDGLLADDRDSGQIRRRIVTITQSTYQPLDNEFQLREAVNTLLGAVNAEAEPFNQSLMLLTGVAYLQPFADCNKRTGRVLANLPLLLSSLPPLSFLTVDKEAYTRGLLTYYELGIGTLIAKAFADAYPASADAYKNNAAVKTKPHEQIGRELRYQGFVRQRLKDIILGETVADAALPDSIPADERSMVVEMLRAQLESLHPGRAAPIGVSSDAIERYLQQIGT